MSTAYAQAPPRDTTAQLYERHSSRIFGFCLSRLGSREDAEDALQLTFLNAQRGLGRGVVPDHELAWLFKIAQNVCPTSTRSRPLASLFPNPRTREPTAIRLPTAKRATI